MVTVGGGRGVGLPLELEDVHDGREFVELLFGWSDDAYKNKPPARVSCKMGRMLSLQITSGRNAKRRRRVGGRWEKES